jgi:hypothetical protein
MAPTDRPLAFWLDAPTDGPEPWATAADRDTIPAPPPSAGRYCLVAAGRVATAPPASGVRACRQTDPCITPPPGSDRMGPRVEVVEAGEREAILPPPWAPRRGTSDNEGKG